MSGNVWVIWPLFLVSFVRYVQFAFLLTNQRNAKIVQILKAACLKPQPLLIDFDLWRLLAPQFKPELRGFLVFGRIIRCWLTVVNYRG